MGSHRTATRVDLRQHLLEQLESLAGEDGGDVGDAGGIAARPREALGQAGRDRIGHAHEDDRNRRRRLLRRDRGVGGDGDEDVDVHAQRARRHAREGAAGRGFRGGSRSGCSAPRHSRARAAPGETPRVVARRRSPTRRRGSRSAPSSSPAAQRQAARPPTAARTGEIGRRSRSSGFLVRAPVSESLVSAVYRTRGRAYSFCIGSRCAGRCDLGPHPDRFRRPGAGRGTPLRPPSAHRPVSLSIQREYTLPRARRTVDTGGSDTGGTQRHDVAASWGLEST